LSFRKLSEKGIEKGGPALFDEVMKLGPSIVEKYYTGEELVQGSVAMDGLTRANVITQTQSIQQPGYREDLLMVFPEAGQYCVIDEAVPANSSITAIAESRRLLGVVAVEAAASGTKLLSLQDQLIASANANMPAAIKGKVVANLQNNMSLASFVWHKTIEKKEGQGTQSVGFNIELPNKTNKLKKPLFQVGTVDTSGNLVKPKSYDPDVVDKVLTLGGVDEWTLKSFLANHPFHIHVNPF